MSYFPICINLSFLHYLLVLAKSFTMILNGNEKSRQPFIFFCTLEISVNVIFLSIRMILILGLLCTTFITLRNVPFSFLSLSRSFMKK